MFAFELSSRTTQRAAVWCLFFLFVCATAVADSSQKTTSAKPPAKVDKALRERADMFLQVYVTGAFSKAYELVAEESRDRFLSMAKEKLVNPTITRIEYSDKFSKAVVTASVVRKANLGMAGVRDIPGERSDAWRVEKGKWVWYFDPTRDCVVTLFGALPCSPADLQARNAPAVKVPEKITPEAIVERMKEMNKGNGFSKPELRFVKGVAGSDETVFHNGLPGQVQVSVEFASREHVGFRLEGFNEPVVLDGYKDLPIKLSYDPVQNSPEQVELRVTLQPFNSTYLIPVKVVPAGPPAAAPQP